jgi:transcriptional regulator with XRE-family HTH domain
MSTTSRDISKELVSLNLRRLMKRSGKTQTDLAKAVCGEVTPTSRVTVHRWCQGKILPTTWQQIQLAKALGAEITELFRPDKKFRKSR